MHFSERVKTVRANLMLTQKELAKELGVSFATVNRWESQGIEPQFLTMKKFERFCEEHKIEFPDEGGNKRT